MNESLISTILGGLVVLVIGILIFNYFRGYQPQQTTTDSDKQILPTIVSENTDLPTTYKVVIKDNLWIIAEKFYQSGYNWVDIAQANNLNNANTIHTGQELKIPLVESKQKTVTPEITLAIQEPISADKYVINKGDNLWKIAVRAYQDGYQWVKIAQANHLDQPNLIHPGNELIIPR